MKRKEFDFFVLIIILLAAAIYSYLTRDLFAGKSLFAGFVFIVIPAIYLSLRKKKNWKKIIISTLVFGGLFGFIFEFIAEFNHAYSVISTITPFKIFGVLPIDNVLGHMMMTMLTVVFYEHFVDR